VADVQDPTFMVVTARLIVRPWRLDDADRFFDIYRRDEVARGMGAEPLRTHREAVEWIDRITARLAADPRFGSWAVVERTTGVPVGGILLKPLPDGDTDMEIGWQLHPDKWGQGLATEAASAILTYGFASGVGEVWAVTHLDNRRSAAVCRRIGMRLLGVTHRWYHEPLLMFWIGARAEQAPSLRPDGPAPGELGPAGCSR
jgi:RimJ/RimL family protein N-acetyltransferase